MPRDEATINAEMAKLQAKYHEESGTFTAAKAKSYGDGLKSLRAEISDLISEGAEPCPACKNKPHGMLKTPATDKAPAKYEVGCLNCPGGRRAQGWSRSEAVAAWNKLPKA